MAGVAVLIGCVGVTALFALLLGVAVHAMTNTKNSAVHFLWLITVMLATASCTVIVANIK
jgi:hypothetical protein